MKRELSLRAIPVIAALTFLLPLLQDLQALFVLQILGSASLVARCSGGTTGGDRLLLSGNGGIDIPEPRTNQGLPVVDASRRRFAPSPPAWTSLAANVRPDTEDGTLITPGGA